MFALILTIAFSCEGDRGYRLSSASGNRIYVAQDKVIMEQIIEDGIRLHADSASTAHLVAEGRVFSVGDGRKVARLEGFSFSQATKIRILEGSHAGQEGWVYERMLQ